MTMTMTSHTQGIAAVGFWTADMTDNKMEDAFWEWAQQDAQ